MQVYKGIILMGGVGYDSNIYIVDGELIIDTGTGLFFSEIKEEIENLGYKLDKLKTIINTHAHSDHTGGNKKFRDWLKADVAIHEADRQSIENGKGTMAKEFGLNAKAITVDKALRNGDRVKTKNFSFEVIHTPGHTIGSICLYDKKKKILISGDTLFADGIGRTDMPTGSSEDMHKSLLKLSKHSVTYLLPGHGMPKITGVDFLIKQMINQTKTKTVARV